MAWVALFFAGLLETAWAIGLKYSHGFTRPLPTALTLVAMAGSLYLLGQAVKTLPIGTAYAVWTGIGAAGAVVLGIILFHESRDPARLFFLVLLLTALVGLRITAGAGG
jgi:quaternary ammonium compound-resistance protein SugE